MTNPIEVLLRNMVPSLAQQGTFVSPQMGQFERTEQNRGRAESMLADELAAAMTNAPERASGLAMLLQRILPQEPKPMMKLGPGDVLFDPNRGVPGGPGEPTFQAPFAPLQPRQPRSPINLGSGYVLDPESGRVQRAYEPEPGRDFPAEQEANRGAQAAEHEASRRFTAEQNALTRTSREEAARISAGGRPATAAALRVGSFYYRMKDAMDSIESTPGGVSSIEQDIVNLGTLGQYGLDLLPNILQSQTGQLYRQAQRQFTEARLRKDSGAAIRDEEYDQDERIYFAVPGDTKQTLERKRSARQNVLAAIKREAGKAVEDATETSGGGKTIRVISPTGQPGSIPAEDLPQAIREGYRPQ